MDVSEFLNGQKTSTANRTKYSQNPATVSERQLVGKSFLGYANMQIPAEETLLGNRWLCRGGGALIVAPSGQGKSVLTAQASILWACGKPAFGIEPSRPLRSLILQAEDDDGDIQEMGEIISHLKLNENEIRMVDTNTFVEPCNDLCGEPLLIAVDQFLTQRPSDLLWINPYSAYLGADVKNSEANNLLLRTGLNPILKKHNCAVILIHHTPKTNFNGTENYKPSDWMYRGSGSADITNWARAIMVIDPCANIGTYKFIAAKRGKRIGWGHEYPVYEEYFSHCKEEGKLLWVPSSEDEIRMAANSKRGTVARDLLPFIPDDEDVNKEQIHAAINHSGVIVGVKKTKRLLDELVTAGLIHVVEVPRSGTRAEVKYRRR
jgi:hypothetical protein